MIAIFRSVDVAPKMSLVRRRIAGVGVSLVGNLAIQIIGLFTSVLAARLFAPAARGDLAAAVAWALIASAVADLGLSQAVPFNAARRILGSGATAVILAFSAAVIVGPLLMVGHEVLGYQISKAAISYSLIGVPFSLTITYIAGLFQGMSHHGTFTIVRIVNVLPYVAGLAFSTVQAGPSPDRVLWTAFGVSIVGCAGLCAFAQRSTSLFGRPKIAVARMLLSYGLKTYPGNLAWAASQRAPILLVGATAGSTALGYYAVAQSYAVVPFAVASAFAFLAPGRIGPKAELDALRAAKSLCRIGLMATWAVTILLLPLSRAVIVPIFGPAYRPSIWAACLLVVASGFLGSNFILSASLRALRWPSIPSYAEMGGLATILALCPVLIRQFGWTGAAVASLAGAVLVSFILCVVISIGNRRGPRHVE